MYPNVNFCKFFNGIKVIKTAHKGENGFNLAANIHSKTFFIIIVWWLMDIGMAIKNGFGLIL